MQPRIEDSRKKSQNAQKVETPYKSISFPSLFASFVPFRGRIEIRRIRG
jgi:hypothetical protein